MIVGKSRIYRDTTPKQYSWESTYYYRKVVVENNGKREVVLQPVYLNQLIKLVSAGKLLDYRKFAEFEAFVLEYQGRVYIIHEYNSGEQEIL